MSYPRPSLTPRQRVELALRGEPVDRVPFTIYECMIPQCSVERDLRNRGLGILNRRPVFRTLSPNVKVHQEIWWEGTRRLTRVFYETPVGTVSLLDEAAGFTTWHHEKLLKTPEDYKVILFMIEDEVYVPNYDAYKQAEQDFGDDAIFRTTFGLEPLQTLISGPYMKMEVFCTEWMDRQDEILKLYHALVEKRREVYSLVAESPASHANYGGNVTPEIIGLKTFEKYYVPHYNEAAEIMHRHGKLIGCHFDANCKLLAKAIAGTDLDYIEAFTPAPDTDMTLAEARQAWPKKTLWLNFPSSLHLRDPAEIETAARHLLTEATRTEGLLMGVTENMPLDRWQQSCTAIMDGLERHANDFPQLYLRNRPCAERAGRFIRPAVQPLVSPPRYGDRLETI